MGCSYPLRCSSSRSAIGQSNIPAVVVGLKITFFLMISVYAVLYTGKVPAGASEVLIGMTLTTDILIAGQSIAYSTLGSPIRHITVSVERMGQSKMLH